MGPMAPPRPTLYRDAALADMAGPSLRKGVSVLVTDRRIVWVRPTSDERELPPDVHVIDAGGSTIVPGMVDAHSHVTLPGGSHWIDRGADPPEELLEVAEHNGDLLSRAGVRWARDVGSPLAPDPRDGRRRALALRVRERWRSDPSRPRVRVAGTWISHSGVITGGLLIEADDGPALLRAASTQLDDGADFLKLYLDGPKKEEEAPWSTEDVRAVVDLAHRRGAKVTAHTGFLVGSRVGIDAGVDSIEHGFELGRGRDNGPPGDVPREHPGNLPILGIVRADDDLAAVRQRRGEGTDRASAGAGDRERPLGAPCGREDRDRHGFRRRVPARKPSRVG